MEDEPFAPGPWWKNVLMIVGTIALIALMTIVSRRHIHQVIDGSTTASQTQTTSQSSN